MTKLLPAIYEHGRLKPTVPLDLPERQKVLLAVVISQDNTPSLLMTKLAEQSVSFTFLNDPRENIYSISDGHQVECS